MLVPAVLPTRVIRFGARENDFCRAALCNANACQGCHREQVILLRRLAHKLKPQQISCRGELIQFAVPVVSAGRHVATIIGGKVRVGRSGAREFKARLAQWRLHGSEPELRRLRAAYYSVPVLTLPKLRGALGLLDMLARLFAENLAHQTPSPTPKDPPCICEAKQFVRLHLGERFTNRQAARALHLEESYFCRLFHRLAKQTFHAYVAQERIAQAKSFLLSSHQPIGQIASDAGFQSASDFNRIFKASVRMTPTEFRQKG